MQFVTRYYPADGCSGVAELDREPMEFTVKDESPFADTHVAREAMKKAYPNMRFDSFEAARDEALRRSFVNVCICSAVYGPDGSFAGRALGGRWG